VVVDTTVQQTNADRAVAAYEAMQRSLLVSNATGLYRESEPWSGNPYAYVWPFSRALVGTLALAGVPSTFLGAASFGHAVHDRVDGLARYWDGSARVPAYASYVGSGDKYHDDNAWIALALIQHYRMGLSSSLSRAEQLFTFARSGWHAVLSDPRPGGVFWVQQGIGFGRTNHDRGTGATAGGAELGLHLAELTGSRAYEPVALTMLNWVHEQLDSSGTGYGPFWNVVRRDGSIDTNLWSYNQGVMIGAHVVRHRLTGSASDLHLADGIARQTLNTFGNFIGHPPSFNAMCFQNMLMLHAATSDQTLQADILQAMQRYADWTWDPLTGARDPTTNLFSFTDAGQPAHGYEPAKLQDQGAMVQLYALLAWNAGDYAKLT